MYVCSISGRPRLAYNGANTSSEFVPPGALASGIGGTAMGFPTLAKSAGALASGWVMSDKSNSLHIFGVLARQHEPMLLAYLLSLVGDHSLAEDLAQQTFLIAYRKINSLKTASAFPTWLRSIARLEALAALRRRGREFPVAPAVVQELDEAYRQLEEEHPTATWEERFHLVEECFAGLPETLQSVCRLHYFEDHKAWQIAEMLTLNLNTVLKRLERSRSAIRDCVQSRMAGAEESL